MYKKYPLKHKKNSLIGVQCATTKPKNSAEIGLVHTSTDQPTRHRSIDAPLIVSVDPKYIFKFFPTLYEIDGLVDHT